MVGIEFGLHALYLSLISSRKGVPVWKAQHKLPIDNWQASLAEWVKANKAVGTPCRVAFSTNKYQLLLVEKPNVPEQELGQALRWTVNDLIGAQEEMLVDYFDLPVQSAGANKVNLVAVSQALVKEVVYGIYESGLELQHIGIEELCQCDLLDTSKEAQITLIQEPGEEVCLSIIKDGKLFFSRRLRGYEQLSSYGLEQIQSSVVDTLSLEIQRSMDYFEGQLRQAPVKRILICMDTPFQQDLRLMLQQNMALECQVFDSEVQRESGLEFSASTITSLGAAFSGIRQGQAA
ncbi:MSHA biogenesis protein MshI [Aliiglaciecola sp. CAU 1673]|uniref:MSHA biogenesis protein MshI n=1 Tax=Aliiglaciecola sp. CAU 1673 TaxID=3032595 RepID=UPI0023DB4EAD|nr:MSHA biogenesis protein MshI [Aliiglaciecola sp. CAU 1673]MDF2179145.1 MSHA biogenesis protein MshI [Aliiglaciecola sp. CAU 1673]